MTLNISVDLSKHPCFNPAVKGRFGRIHLPVAPKCNIKCRYCNRKYDCVNESRPGVTSNVLSAGQAALYLERVLEKEPRITVAGIAGPGDPFANADETMETLARIREQNPEMILCLASNGLALAPYVEELAALRVSHVTVTVNAVDPEIGARIYAWARDGKVIYRGRDAAELLLARQIAAIRKLKENGITVKINSIIIPGINDEHIVEVAKKMQELEADLLNCMALFPNVDTEFADIPQPDKAMVSRIRKQAEEYLPQMRHCTRCRADAVGLLGDDKSSEFKGCLTACATMPIEPKQERPYVAVASMEGVLVNQHLGEAETFRIWERQAHGYRLVEERKSPTAGGGLRRWMQLAKILADCRAVLVSGIGRSPEEVLAKSGVRTVVMNGFIEAGLQAVYEGGSLSAYKVRKQSCDAAGCKGSGGGCL